jgi:hypothetical protein
MIAVVSACVVLLVLTTLLHYEALRGLSRALPILPVPPHAKVAVLIIGAFAAHVAEMWLYAAAMYGLIRVLGPGAFNTLQVPSFSTLLYFSAETYTSLGYGDVVPHGALRLLAGAEALTGLLMIGWSSSLVFVSMERFWDRNDAPAGDYNRDLRPAKRHPRARSRRQSGAVGHPMQAGAGETMRNPLQQQEPRQ